MGNDTGNLSSIADSPYILWATLLIGVVTILLAGLNKSTTGIGAWLNSLRRIGADSKAADIVARDAQIMYLSRDLSTERTARQTDRRYFEGEIDRRDKLSREHIQWDYKVFAVLVKAGLLSKDDDGPPPLY